MNGVFKAVLVGLGAFLLAVIEMVVIVLAHDAQQDDEENGDDKE